MRIAFLNYVLRVGAFERFGTHAIYKYLKADFNFFSKCPLQYDSECSKKKFTNFLFAKQAQLQCDKKLEIQIKNIQEHSMQFFLLDFMNNFIPNFF